MRELLWATFIVVTGTIGFVMWKVNGPQIETVNVSEQSNRAASTVPESAPPATESASPDSGETEAFNPRGLQGEHTTQTGIDIIKEYEGLRLEAYRGPGGKLLIGYGHAQNVTPGMIITEAEAEELLRQDLVDFENGIKQKVRVPINEHELGAMVSLAYTIGGSAFSSSSVMRELNAGNRAKAADAFLLWNKISSGGKLVANAQLTRRREKERALFLSR